MARDLPSADLVAAVENARRGFRHVDTWIFDLDNTLYPASCNLFAEVDRRMSEYIARTIGVPKEHARHLQKAYYRQFGTTLSGLMKVHKLPPGPFLDYVHDIDLSVLPELPELRAAIAKLPGRRLIFTNGSRRHAENVAQRVGLLDLFEDICDITALGYVPKPQRDAFDSMIKQHGVAAERSAMFEDMPQNLVAASDLGMTTVLVHSDYIDHPAQLKIRDWRALPAHIHYLTRDLTGFLEAEIVSVPA
ncbi:pyrimidine 5'-nucleotidase [Hyphomicrobium methylovorum]|uniref:pyrimidine 5'-nucleotidase n=1 Tax=Hyphomicrobium methylovorum TaxID=84 RepID=UPI0015E790A1|nr:pyrimidine 5'-nucleotidase [Hyphomicrobium methylovorum]MBA2126295.1 pyrimidine 5'-nucleotidase [Hyphomicrobium methylovorum]